MNRLRSNLEWGAAALVVWAWNFLRLFGPVAAMSVLGIGGGFLILWYFWRLDAYWSDVRREARQFNADKARMAAELKARCLEIDRQVAALRRQRQTDIVMSALLAAARNTAVTLRNMGEAMREGKERREIADKFKSFHDDWHRRNARSVSVPRQSSQGASDRPRAHTLMPKPRDNA